MDIITFMDQKCLKCLIYQQRWSMDCPDSKIFFFFYFFYKNYIDIIITISKLLTEGSSQPRGLSLVGLKARSPLRTQLKYPLGFVLLFFSFSTTNNPVNLLVTQMRLPKTFLPPPKAICKPKSSTPRSSSLPLQQSAVDSSLAPPFWRRYSPTPIWHCSML